jgi:NAD+ kinase
MATEVTTMRDVLIVAYQSRSDALELAHGVTRHLSAAHVTVATYEVNDDSTPPRVTPDTLVLSLGGDGTFLRAARIAHQADAEVLGVNLGRVGFLLRVSPEFLLDEIDRALAGSLRVEHRVALRVTSSSQPINEFCLNEVVLERSQTGRMVRVSTFIDSDEFLTYSADGVMVATATGSTGYNFSAGGPVISPELNVLVLTPIAPHFTIDRSIVVGSHQPIRLQVIDRDATIVADGAPVGTLHAGESIDVAYDPRGVKVVGTDQLGLGTRLRQSLREGHA